MHRPAVQLFFFGGLGAQYGNIAPEPGVGVEAIAQDRLINNLYPKG